MNFSPDPGLSGLADTHCHLDFPQFDADRSAIIDSGLSSGIDFMITIGSTPAQSGSCLSLAESREHIFATVGCHPHEADSFTHEDLRELEKLSTSKRVVAVGEVGLDYYRNLSSPRNQEDVFVSLMRLARRRCLPLVVHSRQAQEKTLELMASERVERAVIHCFSGDERFLAECLTRGYLVSFTANITYSKAENLRSLVKLCPLERLMLETDAPYLPPEGMRGTRNVPANVRHVAEAVARIKGLTPQEVASATTATARRFFNIETP